MAMYSAKRAGGAIRMQLLAQLRRAIDHFELRMVYCTCCTSGHSPRAAPRLGAAVSQKSMWSCLLRGTRRQPGGGQGALIHMTAVWVEDAT
jgi:hypothetical protein